jgi:hypothetical protein
VGYEAAEMLTVFGVLGVLVLVLRWAFSSRRDSLLARPAKPGAEHEYGLLVPLAAPKDAAEGAEIAAMLQEAGIRAGVVGTQDGLRVMVWPEDLARARALLLE